LKHPGYALWLLYATTGMRRGEALGLQWPDIDLKAGSLSIRRSLVPVDGIPKESEPKTQRAPANVDRAGSSRPSLPSRFVATLAGMKPELRSRLFRPVDSLRGAG